MALPVFREVMLRVYGDRIAGAAPAFPRGIEQRITQYLTDPLLDDHPRAGGREPAGADAVRAESERAGAR